jgi:hypothetical protein
MKSTGIIMSQPMMIADLKNLKTMTRRTRGLNNINIYPDDWELIAVFQDGLARFYNHVTDIELMIKCPYGGVGDEIYLKETWTVGGYSHKKDAEIIYKASESNRYDLGIVPWNDWLEANTKYGGRCGVVDKWRSSMFMPKWACRRKHILTNIRCERVQNITEEDAIKEGVGIIDGNKQVIPQYWESYKKAYSVLWDDLNFKRGYPWSKNNWCWVLQWEK